MKWKLKQLSLLMLLLASFSSLMKKWLWHRMSESIRTFKRIRSFVIPTFFGNIFKRRNVTTFWNILPSDCHAKSNRHRAIISKATVSAGTLLSRMPGRCTTRPPYVTFSWRYFADLEFMFTIVVGQSRDIYGIGKSRSLIYSTTERYSKEPTHADYKVYGRAVTLLLFRYETLPVSQG